MPNCVAPNCSNRSSVKSRRQMQTEEHTNITFHRFPKAEDRRILWANALGLNSINVCNKPYVCSLHFTEESFDRTSQSCVRLRDQAIPFLKIKEEFDHWTTENDISIAAENELLDVKINTNSDDNLLYFNKMIEQKNYAELTESAVKIEIEDSIIVKDGVHPIKTEIKNEPFENHNGGGDYNVGTFDQIQYEVIITTGEMFAKPDLLKEHVHRCVFNKNTGDCLNERPARNFSRTKNAHIEEPSCDSNRYKKPINRLQSDVSLNHEYFRCDTCNKTFTKKHNLVVHINKHTRELPYCKLCQKSFTSSSVLTRHKKTHSVEMPYSCNLCHKSFKQISNLLRHKKIHSGEKPYSCVLCLKSFINSCDLIKHKRIHSGERSYLCNLCQKSFTRSSVLTRHKRTHSGEKPYSCNICQKTFKQSGNLLSHKITHSGDKPYSCKSCEKSFANFSNLLRHNRIHSGEKPYVCNLCQKSFTRSCDLSRHKKTHSTEKQYSCNLCQKSFSQMSYVLIHKIIHSGEKPYSCNYCDKSFAQSSNLSRHKKNHSQEK